jgi:Flp pilus assembly protein TadB
VKIQVAEVEKANENQSLNDYTAANTTPVTDGNTISNTNLKEDVVIDAKETTTSNTKVEQSTTKQPRTIKAAKKNVQSMINSVDDRDSSDGYSLLWIIIIILLVLWALGLIGGFGTSGLLHLLLVIALILLILWLLRVI